MGVVVRDITSDEIRLYGDIVARLERVGPGADARGDVLADIIRLTRSDFGASYVWNDGKGIFERSRAYRMSEDNLKAYDDWFQFRDPMTQQLRARKRATPVELVIPHRRLEHTEFFNDFLSRDGMHHGINLFVFDNGKDLGDLRIWRGKGQPEFEERDVVLLDMLEPFLRRALLRSTLIGDDLTPRERDVAVLVARGCTDRDIARLLGIGFATVRTHLSRAMEKRGCANRAELAATVSRFDN
ncbi:LuxR family transcriptional regulator [Mesorhizobium loti]|nr:helix-turn-helix transcriptional regulator [Mesorhizobium loti]PLP57966.1 LuxR family transcriptional regulator [Mesorhizobium loti]